MKTKFLSVIAFFAGLTVQAQDFSRGQSLFFSADARSNAMAGASSALCESAFSVMQAPAAAALSDNKVSAELSYGLWTPSLASSQSIAAAASWKFSKSMSLGLAAQSILYPAQILTDEYGFESGAYTPNDLRVGLSYAWAPLKSLSIGLNANCLKFDQDFAFSADVQLMYKMKQGLAFSLLAANLGANMPMDFSFAAAYDHEFGNHGISAAANLGLISSAKSHPFHASFGFEYSFHNYVFARAGYHYCANSFAGIPSHASIGLGGKFSVCSLSAYYLFAGKYLNNSAGISFGVEF